MTSSEAILSQHILWGCRGQEAASLVVMLAFHVTLSTKGWYSIKLYIFLVTVSVRSTLLFIWRNFLPAWIFVKMGWIILVLPSFFRIFNFPKVPRRQQKSGTAPTGTGTTTSGKLWKKMKNKSYVLLKNKFQYGMKYLGNSVTSVIFLQAPEFSG